VNPLLPRLWNCVVGAFTPVLCYALAVRLGAKAGAKESAILVALYPSLILWSSLNLKDVDVFCLTLACLLLTLRLQGSVRWKSGLSLAFMLAVLYTLRQFTATALLLAIGIGLLASRGVVSRRTRLARGGLAAATLAVAAILPNAAQQVYLGLDLNTLATTRQNLAVLAKSAVDASPGLQTLAGSLAFLPVGLVDFFLRPFPWEISRSSLQIATLPETIIYYGILPVVMLGVAYSVRARFSSAVPLVSFLLITSLGYALVLGNLGTSYRERDQLLVVMFAFVGVALGHLRAARQRGFEPAPGRYQRASARDAPERSGLALLSDDGAP